MCVNDPPCLPWAALHKSVLAETNVRSFKPDCESTASWLDILGLVRSSCKQALMLRVPPRLGSGLVHLSFDANLAEAAKGCNQKLDVSSY